jgi:hypothetical protein
MTLRLNEVVLYGRQHAVESIAVSMISSCRLHSMRHACVKVVVCQSGASVVCSAKAQQSFEPCTTPMILRTLLFDHA